MVGSADVDLTGATTTIFHRQRWERARARSTNSMDQRQLTRMERHLTGHCHAAQTRGACSLRLRHHYQHEDCHALIAIVAKDGNVTTIRRWNNVIVAPSITPSGTYQTFLIRRFGRGRGRFGRGGLLQSTRPDGVKT